MPSLTSLAPELLIKIAGILDKYSTDHTAAEGIQALHRTCKLLEVITAPFIRHTPTTSFPDYHRSVPCPRVITTQMLTLPVLELWSSSLQKFAYTDTFRVEHFNNP